MYYQRNCLLKRAMVSLCLLSTGFLWGMEQDLAQQMKTIELSSQEKVTVDVNDIQPFSTSPLSIVPHYLYENCNQVTRYTWTPEHIKKLKSAVKTITKKKLEAKYKDQQELIKNAEVYDWIHALNLIETEYLSKDIKAFSLEDLKKINGRITRLVVGNQGELRDRSIVWRKRDLSVTEEIFIHYYSEHIQDLLHNRDRYLKLDHVTKELAIKDLMKWATVLNGPTWKLIDPQTGKIGKVDTQEIETWEQEDAVRPNHTAGRMNWLEWEKSRLHIFPLPNEIEPQLKSALKLIQDAQFHPIEAAARIWYEIVRIHPWGEANKRTGRAVASLILLKHGYLPPLITKENASRYQKILLEGFEKEDGHVPFIHFIAELVAKTQQEYVQTNLK
jgi:hypothetical protein